MGSGCCHFELSRSQVSLSLSSHLLRRLEQQFADTGDPEEQWCGGVLLGNKELDGICTVRLEDCFPIRPAMRQAGNGTSACPDPWLTKQALELWTRDSNSALYAVGQYRISPGTEGRFTPDIDLDEFAPKDILLALSRRASDIVVSTYVVDGKTRSVDVADFEMSLASLKAAAANVSTAKIQNALARAPGAAPNVLPPKMNAGLIETRREERQPPRATAHWIPIASKVCAAALLVPAVFELFSALHLKVKSDQSGTAIGLQVINKPSGLEVTWMGHSSVVKNARSGQLTILDTSARKEIDVGPAELARGHILYVPETDKVSVSLKVVEKDGRAVNESAGSPLSPEDSIPASRPADSEIAEPFGKAVKVETHIANKEVLTPAFVKKASLPDGGISAGFSDLVLRDRLKQALPADQPRPESMEDKEILSGSLTNTLPEVKLRPKIAPSFSALAKPPDLPDTPGVDAGSSLPPSLLKTAATLPQPPVPEKKFAIVPPRITSGSGLQVSGVERTRLQSGTIRLDLLIGDHGELLKIEDIRGPLILRAAAIKAVKSWTFAPAQIHGVPVQAPFAVEMTFKRPD